MCTRVVLLASMVMVLAGCGDDVQYASPPERETSSREAGLPANHPPLSGSPTRTETPASHGTQPDPFAPAEVSGDPGGAQDKPPADKVWFKGRIEVDPSFELSARYTIYVNAGLPPKGRPPVLSRRYAGEPKFPFDFELRQQDVAFGATKVDRPLVLYVIISESGYVMAQTGLYVKTTMYGPFDPESEDVVLTLKKP